MLNFNYVLKDDLFSNMEVEVSIRYGMDGEGWYLHDLWTVLALIN
jgi:hypothetical protein